MLFLDEMTNSGSCERQLAGAPSCPRRCLPRLCFHPTAARFHSNRSVGAAGNEIIDNLPVVNSNIMRSNKLRIMPPLTTTAGGAKFQLGKQGGVR